MNKHILAILLLSIVLSSCAIPIKLIFSENPKESLEKLEEKKVKTETILIENAFGKEKFLIWQAFQKAKINKYWAGEFQVASFINYYYDNEANPTREGLYEYLKKELVGYTIWPIIEDKLEYHNEEWIIVKREIVPFSQKIGYKAKFIDKLLQEVEMHYRLLEKLDNEKGIEMEIEIEILD